MNFFRLIYTVRTTILARRKIFRIPWIHSPVANCEKHRDESCTGGDLLKFNLLRPSMEDALIPRVIRTWRSRRAGYENEFRHIQPGAKENGIRSIWKKSNFGNLANAKFIEQEKVWKEFLLLFLPRGYTYEAGLKRGKEARLGLEFFKTWI